MKTSPSRLIRTLLFATAIAASAILTDHAQATIATYTWNATAPAEWTTATNWTPNTIPGSTTTDVAAFGVPSGTGTGVDLSSSESLGGINFNATAAKGYVISTANGSSITLNNDSTVGNAITFLNTSGSNVVSTSVVLGASSNGYNFTGATGGLLALTGVVSGGSGPLNLSISGAGSYTVNNFQFTNASNSFTGNININSGVFSITSDGALGNSSNSVTLGNATIGNTSDLSFGFSVTNYSRTVTVSASTLSYGISIGSGKAVSFNPSNFTDSQSTTVANKVNIAGGGTLQETANNQFTNANSILLSSNGGTTLDLNGFNATVGNLLDTNGAGVVTNSNNSTLSTITLANVTNGSSKFSEFKGNLAVVLSASTVPGIFSSTAAANTFTGGLTVVTGTAQASQSGPGAMGSGNVTIDSPALVDIHGFSPTVGLLLGSGTVKNLAATSGTLTLAGSGAAQAFSGSIIASTGVIGLTLTSGTQTLSGQNTYTGQTLVNGGRLIVTGSLSGAAATSVAAAGTLGGSGLIAGTMSVSGTLAPGTGLSTAGTVLTIGNNVALNNGSNFVVNLDDPNNKVDSLSITGNLTFVGADTLTVNLVNGDLNSFNTYTLATITGSFSGSLPTLAFTGGANPNGDTLQEIGNSLVLTSVPEPQTWAMLLAGVGLLGVWQRRSRRAGM
jgi:MYXO-CTERM domain-containing protein